MAIFSRNYPKQFGFPNDYALAPALPTALDMDASMRAAGIQMDKYLTNPSLLATLNNMLDQRHTNINTDLSNQTLTQISMLSPAARQAQYQPYDMRFMARDNAARLATHARTRADETRRLYEAKALSIAEAYRELGGLNARLEEWESKAQQHESQLAREEELLLATPIAPYPNTI